MAGAKVITKSSWAVVSSARGPRACADRGDGRVGRDPGGDQGACRNCSAAAEPGHAGDHHCLASLGRFAAPPREVDGVGDVGRALVGDGETVVGESGGLGPGAEVGYVRPVELWVGQQAQEPGGALGAKLGEVGVRPRP